MIEWLDQFESAGITPGHVVFTSSSGGTLAGLLAGRAAAAHGGRWVPDVIAIGVAKGVNLGRPDIAELANHTLTLMGSTAIVAHEDLLEKERLRARNVITWGRKAASRITREDA